MVQNIFFLLLRSLLLFQVCCCFFLRGKCIARACPSQVHSQIEWLANRNWTHLTVRIYGSHSSMAGHHILFPHLSPYYTIVPATCNELHCVSALYGLYSIRNYRGALPTIYIHAFAHNTRW